MNSPFKRKASVFIVITVFLISGVLVGAAIVKLKGTKLEIQTMEDSKITFEADVIENYINKGDKYDGKEIDIKEYKNMEYLYTYENIDFVSYSEEWDEEKLEDLSEELFNNVHGKEIKYVSRIMVYGDEDGIIAGTHEKQYTTLDIPLCLYNFFPDNCEIVYPDRGSIISLYNADTYTTVEDMTFTLSHEYGHHFTIFHFGIDGDDGDKSTEYYKLRAKDFEDNIVTERMSTSDYIENHKWFLVEIAAEDYVYLMGSDATKQTAEFYDDVEKKDRYISENRDNTEEHDYGYKSARNSEPHENPALPLPQNVEGLKELFYSFVGRETVEYTDSEPRPDLNLQFVGRASDYVISWELPYQDEDIIYTVAIYDDDDNLLYALKSINGAEKPRAIMKYESILHLLKIEPNKIYRFRVTITNPDSTVTLSKYLDVKKEKSMWWIRRESEKSGDDSWERN